MLKQLKIKFVIINLTIVTIMLFIIFSLVYGFTQRNLETESINMMHAIATSPFQARQPDDASSDVKLPFFILQLSLDGKLISANGGYYDLSDEDFLNNLIAKAKQGTQDTGIIKENNLRYCRMKMPMGTVLVFSDMSSENRTLSNLLHSLIVIGLIIFFIFLIISIFLAQWAVKPVAQAWTRQKQFVADASHELKTPLTVILTNAELLQCEEYSKSEQDNFLQSITMMSQQMKLLVEKMLLLAKSDNHDTAICMKTINLSDLALNSEISFEGIFVEKGITLESSIASDIKVHGNSDMIKQLIDILLDNAQKYSYENTISHISLTNTDHHKCCLMVSNQGIPIPADELTNIFLRFYRTDKSRSRDGSFGLGLSIAANIVKQHNGKIWAESANGVNTFYVEFRRT